MSDFNLPALIEEQRHKFAAVCADTSIQFEREASFATQIIMANDYILGIAKSNPQSVRNAVTNVAAIGITLNPAQKLAYLVPRDRAIKLDISYMGLMHIAQVSGAIVWGQSAIVRKADKFELQGIDKPPIHTYDPFSQERGDISGVYVVVKTDTGDFLTHAMPISAVYKIRDRSESWKAGKASPWKSDEEEMIKKTCVKQASKYWPRRERLDSTIHYLNTEGEEGLPPIENPAPKSGRVSTQLWEALTEDARQRLADAAIPVKDLLASGDIAAAVDALDAIKYVDENETVAITHLFASHERSAMKRVYQHREELERESQEQIARETAARV